MCMGKSSAAAEMTGGKNIKGEGVSEGREKGKGEWGRKKNEGPVKRKRKEEKE